MSDEVSQNKGVFAALRRFRNWFQNLKVAQKLMLISVFFLMPDSLMLYFFITGINANIDFARMEMKGNAYQRPLEDLLELLPQHGLLARANGGDSEAAREQIASKEAQIDKVFDNLETVDARIGADLQFTDEGLAKRKREHYRVGTVRKEWEDLKKQLPTLDPAKAAEAHLHLMADVRVMITHAGDMSNLILDPDLDSYYLMDATLLALPQTQDRLSQVINHGLAVLSHPTLTNDERSQFAIYATLLKQADLDRVVGSIQTALNEDPNFYKTSPSLQERVPPALEKYRSLNEAFIQLTTHSAGQEHSDISVEDYIKAGSLARDASFRLWRIADEEIDTLLVTRIHDYEWRRTRSLLVAALAVMAAFGLVTFITRSISGPLRAQALELSTANESLQAEIVERKRAEGELRRSEGHLAAAQKIASIGSWDWNIATKTMSWSNENYRIHGLDPAKVTVDYQKALRCVHPEDRNLFSTHFDDAISEGKTFSFEHRIVLRNKSIRIVHQRGAVLCDESGTIVEVFGTAQDITERKEAEEELEKVHQALVKVSRQAGMAEVATGVLHNVGNVLNSVNVSAMLISERLGKSRIAHLENVCSLFRENNDDLAHFFTNDPRGRKLPTFLYSLSERLASEQATLLAESEGLAKNITHIMDIVAVQQNYARVSGVIETLPVAHLVDDALEMNGAAFDRHRVTVVKALDDVPPVRVDKHKVLQILINVLGNAKYAVSDSNRKNKKIVVTARHEEPGLVQIDIKDNGVGIAPANLARIFAHGFTTKKDGHGFGLHSAALAATEIGGSLTAHSSGLGRGATFTLKLPVDQENYNN